MSEREIEAAARAICAVEGFDPNNTAVHEEGYWVSWVPHATAALAAAAAVRSGPGESVEPVAWELRQAMEALIRIAFMKDTSSVSGDPSKWPSTIAYNALGGRSKRGKWLDDEATFRARLSAAPPESPREYAGMTVRLCHGVPTNEVRFVSNGEIKGVLKVSHSESPRAAPEGWVLVPVKVPDEFRTRLWDFAAYNVEEIGDALWDAMIAAAPPPPSQEHQT